MNTQQRLEKLLRQQDQLMAGYRDQLTLDVDSEKLMAVILHVTEFLDSDRPFPTDETQVVVFKMIMEVGKAMVNSWLAEHLLGQLK